MCTRWCGHATDVVLQYSTVNYIVIMKYLHLLIIVGIFVIIMIFLNKSECGGRICQINGNMSREMSLLATKYNPSDLNKAIDAL
jgi:hypothetical protein